MAYYSNIHSLTLAYGGTEVSGLLKDESGNENDVRLEKAAAAAFSEINDYLHTAGYTLPLEFEPATKDSIGTLNGTIQRISDLFTVWYLANSEDLSKQRYDKQREDALAYLKGVVAREFRIYGLEIEGALTGYNNVVVLARKRIFDIDRISESALLVREFWP